jgi:predicted transposase/invertase (TIGR01784 family)
MNRKFISHSNFVLRKILNSRENLDIIQDFIETFLKIEIKEINLNPYLISKSQTLPSEENFGIIDARIKLNNNEERNIGIQFIDGCLENVQNKILLYYAQIHANQLEHDSNRKVAKTITINLLDFNYFESSRYEQRMILMSNPDEYGYSQEMEIYTLELPKFDITKAERIGKKEAWMIFLSGKEIEKFNKEINKFDKIRSLNELLEEYWNNEKME